MNYWHLLLDLPAVIGGASMLSLLSPWKMQARAVPALLFAVGLLTMFLPMTVVVGLALMLPAAWLSARLGIEHAGHDPLNVAPAVELARKTAVAAREKVRTAEPVELRQFVAKAYPAPTNADTGNLVPDEPELAHDDDIDDAEDQEPEAPVESISDKIDSLINDPSMPAGAHQKLAGQRAGRMSQPGLRELHAPVQKFVPSLI